MNRSQQKYNRTDKFFRDVKQGDTIILSRIMMKFLEGYGYVTN